MEKERKQSKKKSVIQYSLIVLAAITLGITSGVIAKRNLSEPETDYSGFNPEDYRADSKALLKSYQSNPNKSFSPVELVNIGLEKYRQCEYSYSIGVGVASTIVNQTIRNAQIRNGDKYFEESISNSSMVHIANRVSQEGVGSNISLNKGKATGAENCSYGNNITDYSSDDYKKNWGKTLDEMFIYILSDKTVVADQCSIEKTKDNLIKIKLELDKDISSYYYKVQMKSISNLSGLPVFEYLKQTYVFSEDMTLKYCQVDEKYTASMVGIKANIHNTIDYYYHANEKIDIPQLDELVNYSIEGEVKYE